MKKTPHARARSPKRARSIRVRDGAGATLEEFLEVVRGMDKSTRAFFAGTCEVLLDHGRDRVIHLCESTAKSYRHMPSQPRPHVGRTDRPTTLPQGFPLPPECLDALGALTFARSLLATPNDLIDDGARVTLLGLVAVALMNLEPAPLPGWFFAWQAFDEEDQQRVAEVVADIVKLRTARKRPH